MSQTATVAYASLDRFRRTIVTSDLHGNLAGFRALLQKAAFLRKMPWSSWATCWKRGRSLLDCFGP